MPRKRPHVARKQPARKPLQWLPVTLTEKQLKHPYYQRKHSKFPFREGCTRARLHQRKWDTSAKRAWAIQCMGTPAVTSCTACSEEKGPFADCIAFHSENRLACGNCTYDRRQCFNAVVKRYIYLIAKVSRCGGGKKKSAVVEKSDDSERDDEEEEESGREEEGPISHSDDEGKQATTEGNKSESEDSSSEEDSIEKESAVSAGPSSAVVNKA